MDIIDLNLVIIVTQITHSQMNLINRNIVIEVNQSRMNIKNPNIVIIAIIVVLVKIQNLIIF